MGQEKLSKRVRSKSSEVINAELMEGKNLFCDSVFTGLSAEVKTELLSPPEDPEFSPATCSYTLDGCMMKIFHSCLP